MSQSQPNTNAPNQTNTPDSDAVIHQYASDPRTKVALDNALEFLKDLQSKYPDAPASNADDFLDAEITHIKHTEPDRWQQFKQQLRTLPQDLRDRDRLIQASRSSLVQVATDLTDNIFLNAFVAFLDGLSSDPS